MKKDSDVTEGFQVKEDLDLALKVKAGKEKEVADSASLSSFRESQ